MRFESTYLQNVEELSQIATFMEEANKMPRLKGCCIETGLGMFFEVLGGNKDIYLMKSLSSPVIPYAHRIRKKWRFLLQTTMCQPQELLLKAF